MDINNENDSEGSSDKQARPQCFAGFRFVVHLAGPALRAFPPDKPSFTDRVRQTVERLVVENGGEILSTNDKYVEGATHVVVSHKQQQAAREAVRQNQGQNALVQVVNADWVMVSADCKEALPMEWTFEPFPGPHTPGVPLFPDYTRIITVSGIRDKALRMLLMYKVECMGGRASYDIPARYTSHVLLWEGGPLSKQMETLVQRAPHVRLVHYSWLRDCAAQWALLDDEPYLLHPPGSAPQDAGRQGSSPAAPVHSPAAGEHGAGPARQPVGSEAGAERYPDAAAPAVPTRVGAFGEDGHASLFVAGVGGGRALALSPGTAQAAAPTTASPHHYLQDHQEQVVETHRDAPGAVKGRGGQPPRRPLTPLPDPRQHQLQAAHSPVQPGESCARGGDGHELHQDCRAAAAASEGGVPAWSPAHQQHHYQQQGERQGSESGLPAAEAPEPVRDGPQGRSQQVVESACDGLAARQLAVPSHGSLGPHAANSTCGHAAAPPVVFIKSEPQEEGHDQQGHLTGTAELRLQSGGDGEVQGQRGPREGGPEAQAGADTAMHAVRVKQEAALSQGPDGGCRGQEGPTDQQQLRRVGSEAPAHGVLVAGVRVKPEPGLEAMGCAGPQWQGAGAAQCTAGAEGQPQLRDDEGMWADGDGMTCAGGRQGRQQQRLAGVKDEPLASPAARRPLSRGNGPGDQAGPGEAGPAAEAQVSKQEDAVAMDKANAEHVVSDAALGACAGEGYAWPTPGPGDAEADSDGAEQAGRGGGAGHVEWGGVGVGWRGGTLVCQQMDGADDGEGGVGADVGAAVVGIAEGGQEVAERAEAAAVEAAAAEGHEAAGVEEAAVGVGDVASAVGEGDGAAAMEEETDAGGLKKNDGGAAISGVDAADVAEPMPGIREEAAAGDEGAAMMGEGAMVGDEAAAKEEQMAAPEGAADGGGEGGAPGANAAAGRADVERSLTPCVSGSVEDGSWGQGSAADPRSPAALLRAQQRLAAMLPGLLGSDDSEAPGAGNSGGDGGGEAGDADGGEGLERAGAGPLLAPLLLQPLPHLNGQQQLQQRGSLLRHAQAERVGSSTGPGVILSELEGGTQAAAGGSACAAADAAGPGGRPPARPGRARLAGPQALRLRVPAAAGGGGQSSVLQVPARPAPLRQQAVLAAAAATAAAAAGAESEQPVTIREGAGLETAGHGAVPEAHQDKQDAEQQGAGGKAQGRRKGKGSAKASDERVADGEEPAVAKWQRRALAVGAAGAGEEPEAVAGGGGCEERGPGEGGQEEHAEERGGAGAAAAAAGQASQLGKQRRKGDGIGEEAGEEGPSAVDNEAGGARQPTARKGRAGGSARRGAGLKRVAQVAPKGAEEGASALGEGKQQEGQEGLAEEQLHKEDSPARVKGAGRGGRRRKEEPEEAAPGQARAGRGPTELDGAEGAAEGEGLAGAGKQPAAKRQRGGSGRQRAGAAVAAGPGGELPDASTTDAPNAAASPDQGQKRAQEEHVVEDAGAEAFDDGAGALGKQEEGGAGNAGKGGVAGKKQRAGSGRRRKEPAGAKAKAEAAVGEDTEAHADTAMPDRGQLPAGEQQQQQQGLHAAGPVRGEGQGVAAAEPEDEAVEPGPARRKKAKVAKQEGHAVIKSEPGAQDAAAPPRPAASTAGLEQRQQEQAAPLVFGLSGFSEADRKRHGDTLKRLKCTYVPLNKEWDTRINALLAPCLKRSDKTVCAMAAGAWMLREDYLATCARGHQPGHGHAAAAVDPAPFELSDCKDGESYISTGAPAHWRRRTAAHGGAGAFASLRVFVPAGLPPPLDSATVTRMVAAGGGGVVAGGKGTTAGAAAKGCHVAVVPSSYKGGDKLVRELAVAGVPAVEPQWVVDWVAHPWRELAEWYREGGASPGAELRVLENGRGQA